MSLIKKIHHLSLAALNLCAWATLISLGINVCTAICMYIADHSKRRERSNP